MRVDDTIHIDAPVAVVWAVTTDVERWPEWLPTMESVKRMDDGPFRLGSRALIKQRGLPEAEWSVTEIVHGERYSWEARVRGMRMVGSHILTPSEIGTMNRLSLEMFGLPAVLLWPLIRTATRWALSKENRELKNRCETLNAEAARSDAR